MEHPKVLNRFPDYAGKAFHPSNGTEGMIFCEHFCDQCIHCDPNPEGPKQCEILMLTMCYSPKDKEYPKEWIYNAEGWPTCTNWQKWDWNNDGDPNDPDNPKAPPPPPDPNQLNLFPLYPDETIFTEKKEKQYA